MNQSYKNTLLFLVLGFPMKEQSEGLEIISLSNNKKLQLAYCRISYQQSIKKTTLTIKNQQ
jgi:hypothetical protein